MTSMPWQKERVKERAREKESATTAENQGTWRTSAVSHRQKEPASLHLVAGHVDSQATGTGSAHRHRSRRSSRSIRPTSISISTHQGSQRTQEHRSIRQRACPKDGEKEAARAYRGRPTKLQENSGDQHMLITMGPGTSKRSTMGLEEERCTAWNRSGRWYADRPEGTRT